MHRVRRTNIGYPRSGRAIRTGDHRVPAAGAALATGPIALVQPILVLELGFGEKVRTGGWLAGADFDAVLIVGCTGLLAWSPLNDERGRVGDLDKGAGDREIRQRVSSSDPVRYPPAP